MYYCMRSLPLLLLIACTAGCRTGGIPILNYLPLSKPVNAVIAMDSPVQAAFALQRYEMLRKALAKSIGREVHMEVAFPLLLESGLETGWQQVAILSPAQYASLSESGGYEVLALGSTEARGAQSALLITAADSGLSGPTDLRGKRVAFGPSENSRLSAAAVILLEDSGVKTGDLKKQLLPVPGSLMHLGDSKATAQAVLKKDADAAVVDESYFESLPESGGAGEVSRSQFRVLGKTMSLPDRLFVSSSKLDRATAEKIRDFLVRADHTSATALEKANIKGFDAPTPEVIDNLRRLRGKSAGNGGTTARSDGAAEEAGRT